MRILYVAKHDCNGNDDEGAIAHALRALGHGVHCVHENPARRLVDLNAVESDDYDICLFHKWDEFTEIERLAFKVPCVFWYFDLVEYDDPVLEARNRARIAWMRNVMPLVHRGFCTDGDWADKHKLYHLPQGADGRYVGFYDRSPIVGQVLVLASKKGGTERDRFFNEMQRYSHTLTHRTQGLRGKQLAEHIAGTKVVVAPSAPVTDKYWSNRVYIVLGFGGILLHPFSLGLSKQFQHDCEIVYYSDYRDMHAKLEALMSLPAEERTWMQLRALAKVRQEHLYKDRVKELLQHV